jgi:hypothetical protein
MKYHTFQNNPFFTSANTKTSTVGTTVRDIWYDNNIAFENNANLFGFTNNTSNKGGDNISLIFKGYFKPDTTGVYKFMFGNIDSKHGNDDISVFWIDDKKDVNQTTSHWPPSDTNWNNKSMYNITNPSEWTYESATLTAGTYYPIQLSWGQSWGGSFLKFSFTTGGNPWRSNGDGFFFSDTDPGFTVNAPPAQESNTPPLILDYASSKGFNSGQAVGRTIAFIQGGIKQNSSDSRDSYYFVPKVPKNTAGYSFSFFMNLTSKNRNYAVLSLRSDKEPKYRLLMWSGGGDSGTITLYSQTSGNYNTNFKPELNKPYHIVWTLDTSNKMSFYVNGSLNYSSTQKDFYQSFDSSSLYLFNDYDSNIGNMVGNLENFQYYNGILTQTQITNLSNRKSIDGFQSIIQSSSKQTENNCVIS